MAISCMEVPDDFHARFDTKAKTYRYKIKCNKNPDVFDRKYTWHLKKELDVLKMQEACKYFVGEHDFKSFMSAGNQVESSVRCIYSLDVVKKSSDLIEIYIKANGYLYNMVRIITGTLVDIGLNRYEPEFVTEIINAKDRSKAGPTAPPQGLSLYKVEY